MSEKLQGEDWVISGRKRAFDIAVSTPLLPIALSASALGAVVFLAESKVNPFFYQTRLGRNNEPIRIVKLRSMPFNHDFCDGSNGHDDLRASKVGRVLRKTTLDEAPQVLHILAGQMSIVGPRPLVHSDVERTMGLLSPSEQKEWQRARSIAKPGWLSDFGNVSREILPQTEDYLLARVENDCHYLEVASLETDLRIIKGALGIGSKMFKQTI